MHPQELSRLLEGQLLFEKEDEAIKLLRACFYLGHGTVFMYELLRNPSRFDQAVSILETAADAGMCDLDRIVLYGPKEV